MIPAAATSSIMLMIGVGGPALAAVILGLIAHFEGKLEDDDAARLGAAGVTAERQDSRRGPE